MDSEFTRQLEGCVGGSQESEDMFDGEKDWWAGVELSSLPRLGPGSVLAAQHAPVRPGPDHTVTVRLPVTPDTESPPQPHPDVPRDRWDGRHVRLPWSPDSLYPVQEADKTVLRPRWQLVTSALSRPLATVQDLQTAVLSYNSRYSGKQEWSFGGLERLVSDQLSEEEREEWWGVTLPGMVELLLQSPALLTCPLPLLAINTQHSLTLSQLQVAVILVNAFFCTFPRRNARGSGSEFASYPAINFNTLYGECGGRRQEAQAEKLKCLLSYFSRVVGGKCPAGLISFSRQCGPVPPAWSKCPAQLAPLHLSARGNIESEGAGMLQVDFANRTVGGGVLRTGLVQEEIRFTTWPELLASLLFTETLGEDEVLVVVGAEQFTSHTGYSDTFRFAGRHWDTTMRDSSGRRQTSLVAMDALRYRDPGDQWRPANIRRELGKALAGFSNPYTASLAAVATGNWGCGAFGGCPRLKLLLQWLAASVAGRPVCYLTWGDTALVREAGRLAAALTSAETSVGRLHTWLLQYCQQCGQECRRPSGEHLYSWLLNKLDAPSQDKQFDAETDSEGENLTVEDVLANGKVWTNNSHTECERVVEKNDVNPEENKPGGFFAALDKMERGELDQGKSEDQHTDERAQNVRENLDQKSEEIMLDKKKLPSTQCKMTDFFVVK